MMLGTILLGCADAVSALDGDCGRSDLRVADRLVLRQRRAAGQVGQGALRQRYPRRGWTQPLLWAIGALTSALLIVVASWPDSSPVDACGA
jgi:hypothetical protein